MKRLSVIFVLTLLSILVFAQRNTMHVISEKYGFWDNWEVSLNAGMQTIYNIPNKKDNMDLNPNSWHSFAPVFDLYVSKWINHVFGVRLGFSGISTKYYYKGLEKDNIKLKNNSLTTHINALLSISNWLGNYYPNSFFNFSVFAGVGFMQSKRTEPKPQSDNKTQLIVPIGLLSTYSINENWGINLEFRDFLLFGSTPHNELTPQTTADFSNQLSVSAGVTYKFTNKF